MRNQFFAFHMRAAPWQAAQYFADSRQSAFRDDNVAEPSTPAAHQGIDAVTDIGSTTFDLSAREQGDGE
jgi:hypothetical protein